MARDCNQVFQQTYRQMLTNGLTDAAATSAAQAAMNDCLGRQSSRPRTIAQPISVTDPSPKDTGPTRPPRSQR